MPVISRFFGILIYMYWREHYPAHFHARYADQEITVEIESGKVTGEMSRRALALVEEWRQLHVAELIANWNLAEQQKAISKIPPLE